MSPGAETLYLVLMPDIFIFGILDWPKTVLKSKFWSLKSNAIYFPLSAPKPYELFNSGWKFIFFNFLAK